MTDAIVKSFRRAMGNGVNMGKDMLQAVDHVRETRDTTVIVKLIQIAKKENDTNAETAIKFTFGQIYTGAKITKTKTGISIKIKDATLSNAGVDTLKNLVASGVSMRGTNWTKAFKNDEDEAKELDYIKQANALIKKGYNPLTLIAALEEAAKKAA
tara:strand:+ start:1146 stop:1613 length:468 start_codon:yes stop_codon:yes gene_type:complete